MSKHTPGPWTYEKSGRESGLEGDMPAIFGPDREVICDFGDSTQYYPTEGVPPSEADARLIAAAPDLLQALQELIAEADAPVGWSGHNGNTAGFDMARAAIAKAEGK